MPLFGTTNILANSGTDIGQLFFAYSAGTQAPPSSWRDGPGNRELSTILQPLSGAQQVPNTGCLFPDGTDIATHYGQGGVVGSGAYFNTTNTLVVPSTNPIGSASCAYTTSNDGTTNSRGSGAHFGNWYLPTTSGVGSLYWVRYTWSYNPANPPPSVTNGAVGWTSISGNPQISFLVSSSGESITSNGTCTIQIASDSGGSNVVYSQTVNYTATVTVSG